MARSMWPKPATRIDAVRRLTQRREDTLDRGRTTAEQPYSATSEGAWHSLDRPRRLSYFSDVLVELEFNFKNKANCDFYALL